MWNLEKTNENNKKIIDFFDTNELTLDINHPIDIECQTSYDGSTNIIFNDDSNPPRVINSAFSVKEGSTYERVQRNQQVPTNIYRENSVQSETRLQRVTSATSGFLSVDLKEVCGGGELPGGNYVFLIHYADDDDNISKVMAESGIVSIFGGHLAKPNTMYSTLLHEKTEKMIKFTLKNVDESFSKVYISFKRDFCDLTGTKQTEYKKIIRPYKIKGTSLDIIIDGREQLEDVLYNELVALPNVYQKVKTQTQNQNMLFFGNVEESYDQIVTLQKLALSIQVQPIRGNAVGDLQQTSYDGNAIEYFNVHNIYDNVGYMPEEYYRIGIVFIYNDDTRSSVYNLRGYNFSTLYQLNYYPGVDDEKIDINELFIDKHSCTNTKGVFRMPSLDLHAEEGNITPIVLQFKLPAHIIPELKQLGIKGYYYVRQARVPIFLAQGFSVGVSNTAYIPLLSTYMGINEAGTKDGVTFGTDSIFIENDKDPKTYKKEEKNLQGKYIHLRPNRRAIKAGGPVNVRGLVCPDAILNPQLQSLFCGSRFVLKNIANYNSCNLFINAETEEDGEYEIIKKVNLIRTGNIEKPFTVDRELIYIPPETSYRSYKNYVFSTKAGSSVDVKSLRSVNPEVDNTSFKLNSNCVRGNYIPFVGVVSDKGENENELEPNTIYNIYSEEYSNNLDAMRASIQQRAFDKSEFTAICDAQTIIADPIIEVECARGDCFTCTSQHKFSYNFLDHNAPLNEVQVKGFIEYQKVGDQETPPAKNQFFTETIDNLDASAWLE